MVLWRRDRAMTQVCMDAETVPECHFFQPLNFAVRQDNAAHAARTIALCLRPNAAHVSLQNPSAALATCITPSAQHNGVSLEYVSNAVVQ